MFHPQERYSDTDHAKIFLAQPRSMPWSQLAAQLRQCEIAVREFDEPRLKQLLEQLQRPVDGRDVQVGVPLLGGGPPWPNRRRSEPL